EAFTSALKTAYDSAVTNSHTHANKGILDAIQEALTTALKAAYDNAVTLAHSNALDHIQGTDQKLDEGGANEVTVADIKDAVDKKDVAGVYIIASSGGDYTTIQAALNAQNSGVFFILLASSIK
ncbi:unnamed protein product, partial [marine sediment metagenome]